MPDQMDTAEKHPSAGQRLLVHLAQAVRFFSRFPVPTLPFEAGAAHHAPDPSGLMRMAPVAGLLIGVLPALILAFGLSLGLGSWLAATLAVAFLTAATGGLHEDGLADMADSFGGTTRERRLAIMRDSRIGSYGASALMLGFALRIGALATLADQFDSSAALAGLLMAASLSRIAALAPLAFLDPARTDGASHAVGKTTRDAFWIGAAVAAGLALAIGGFAALPASSAACAILGAALAAWGMTLLGRRHLGGHTGDLAGATQQLAEIAALIGLLIALGR